MVDVTIRSLRLNVAEAAAYKMFEGSGPFAMLRQARQGPIQRLATVYLPFRVYRVAIHNGNLREDRVLAIDAVSGTLDLYRFEHPPSGAETVPVKTHNFPTGRLDADSLEEKLREKVQRTLFRRGFFRLRDYRLEVAALPDEIHVPYWVAFRGRGEQAQIDVLDAVRSAPEGGKVKLLIEQWLAG